ncbi:DUF4013 domain-containing protein [Methanothermococcus okinawensis]|uniref:DUF4013 domain-containing protein n=1 Tax=Methanothermococcus okinawensis (strain DSM 14208 / JCM 11175 / IH1) TaxID=647113 RepID=F8ANK2_METOI|nr:DUF4013 domain-containing protein [Methanothermococcus okinawensis]AEH07056.1 hypothetical protein Metok_1086 [Methanothermococcus okinawensis IH1]
MELSDGLKYPMEDTEWIKKIIIGGILNIIPIVNFISFGYALETMESIIINKNQTNLPEWDEFGSKFIKGFMGIIISIIYLIIPIIIMIITTFSYGHKSTGLFVSGISVSGILMIIIGFILPMALANYVAKGSFGAAFELGEIIGRIKSVVSEYIVCYVVMIVLYVVAGFISAIPIIGWIIGAILGFYLQLVYAYYFGNLYTKSSY